MPKKTSHPHVSWRNGRPRFNPDQRLRAAGHKGMDLRHPNGLWYTRGECVDWSERFVASLAPELPQPARKAAPKSRASTVRPSRPTPPAAPPRPALAIYTVERLFDQWFRSAKFQIPKDVAELRRLRAAKAVVAPNTLRSYKQLARVIESHDPSLWASPVDALSQPVLVGLYEELVAARGLASARGAIAVFSAALAWGKRRGKFTLPFSHGQNPAEKLGMKMAPPRIRFASRTEISALIAMADHLGWPEMGDMVALGLWTGQRQGDRLNLVDKGLVNGRRVFRQVKTGAIVAIRQAPELEARLKASAARRRAAGVASPRVILDEQRWRIEKDGRRAVWEPYREDHFRHRFAELRTAAAGGVIDERKTAAIVAEYRRDRRNEPPPVVWKLKPCRSLLGDEESGLLSFHESDLRDTAVTWMAIAGATIPEVCAVTGHTLQSATTILKHYLAVHPEMADSAIGKMLAWYDAGGEAETGL